MSRLEIKSRIKALPGVRKSRQQGLSFLVKVALLAVLASFAVVPFAYPQDRQATEYQLKAAFLFNFAKFIDWPDKSFASPQSPFTICVIGQDPFGGALNEYLEKSIAGRSVHISHFMGGSALTEARHCQIAFISASEKTHFHAVIEGLNGNAILLVGDADGFAASGGTIEFTLEDNHIRFSINPDAAQRADLKVSSKLLGLAKIVHDGSNNGKS
jgi:hypothetical protein